MNIDHRLDWSASDRAELRLSTEEVVDGQPVWPNSVPPLRCDSAFYSIWSALLLVGSRLWTRTTFTVSQLEFSLSCCLFDVLELQGKLPDHPPLRAGADIYPNKKSNMYNTSFSPSLLLFKIWNNSDTCPYDFSSHPWTNNLNFKYKILSALILHAHSR